MFIKQLFDISSSTYTYLVACTETNKAIIIDPVIDHVDEYIEQLEKNALTLVAALDTHIHADHVTALGSLRSKTHTTTFLGKPQDVDYADNPLRDGLVIPFGNLKLEVIYTPGHTDDSHCFLVNTTTKSYLFTGDTLLIGGTGRTDFQNGNAGDLYDSIHRKLLTLPENSVIYPGHDYHGKTQSTIGHEKQNNVRLNIKDKGTFIQFMNNLNLPEPKQMRIAIPANRSCGNQSIRH